MYLEISGRGTGKTYRLIQTAKEYVLKEKGNIANIVAPTLRQAQLIQEKIEKDQNVDHAQFTYRGFDHKQAIVHGYENVRNFYEEFDFMPFEMKKNDPFFFGPFFKRDYYVTTPAKIRDLSKTSLRALAKTDFLVRLLLENGNYHISYTAMDFDPAYIQRFKAEMKPEAFEAEMEGRFFKH